MKNLNQALQMAELNRKEMEAEKLRIETLKLQNDLRWQYKTTLIVAALALITSIITAYMTAK